MAVCSFSNHSSKSFGSLRGNADIVFIPLKSCTKNISDHLRGCYKTPQEGLDEWELCLFRAGIFHQEHADTMTICPIHRNQFGLGWRPSRTCKHPAHTCKQKPVRGVTKRISIEIQRTWQTVCEIGQGTYYHFIVSFL